MRRRSETGRRRSGRPLKKARREGRTIVFLRRSDKDTALVIAGGITVFEALAAYDQLEKEGISIRIIDLSSV